ncbi:phosphatidic acid phosphatase type 2/haloperoxidase [Umbelopsis sp. AD052]|nr:phosphatidic acid phosphatase type 2/haloperoxidase [Umbelopsis sp. AD052]
MPKKVFKTISDDIDAGLHDDRLYDKALHPWRAKLRRIMLPLIRMETPYIAAFQNKVRTPMLDVYFLWTANLGTHTFFMIFLPLLFWFGYPQLGRSLVAVMAFGVFWSGFIKDFMCLPRPLSPPVHRLTMSSSVALEYGFPSTHSTNSISVALFLMAWIQENVALDDPFRLPGLITLSVYAVSVVFGRIYCGMHSITDLLGGAALAYVLYWFHWTFRAQFEEIVTGDSYWIWLSIPLLFLMVGIHPDPIERCPCFEDSVCFLGVLIGLLPASWVTAHSSYSQAAFGIVSGSRTATGSSVILISIVKVVIGVAILFIWRMACKTVCYFILPPIYRAFNLPHRKFEIGARTYKNLRHASIHPVPSVLDLRGLTSSVRASDHVGVQSGIDLHEKRVYEARHRFQNNLDEKVSNTPSTPTLVATALQEKNATDDYDPSSLLIVEDSPLRYDVDIVTKLIVYAGIGALAVHAIPILFEVTGMGLDAGRQ